VLLAENRDKGLHVFFINQVDDPEAKNHRWRQYREIWGFVEGDGCRRQAILRHFGDRGEAHTVGRCCDVCDGPLAVAAPKPRARSVAESADVADAIVAVVERAEPSVGRTKTVEILRGGRSKALLKYSYDALPGYGDFADWRAEDVLAEVDALLDSGRLRSTGGRYPTLRVAEAA
jgi:ATP-dependent DNA helicase RecQ